MTDDLTHHGSTRLMRGMLLRYGSQGWLDRDSVTPSPSLRLLAYESKDVLQMWKGGKPSVIDVEPLPDPDELNAAIPKSEWEVGMDGQPQDPWKHTVVAYFVDVNDGSFYSFISPTIGAHMAIGALRESIIGKRMLDGGMIMPVVKLSTRPMQTRFGVKVRPHFDIESWRTPPDNRGALPAAPATQAIASPTPEVKSPEAPPTAMDRPPGTITILKQPKPAVSVATSASATAESAKPPFDDAIPENW